MLGKPTRVLLALTVARLTAQQHKSQGHPVGVAQPWVLVVSPPRLWPRAWPDGSSAPLFPAPDEARAARTAVESIIGPGPATTSGFDEKVGNQIPGLHRGVRIVWPSWAPAVDGRGRY